MWISTVYYLLALPGGQTRKRKSKWTKSYGSGILTDVLPKKNKKNKLLWHTVLPDKKTRVSFCSLIKFQILIQRMYEI